LAWVFTEHRAEQIAQKIVEFAASPQHASEIRARYVTDRMEPGNRVAAEKILEVLAALAPQIGLHSRWRAHILSNMLGPREVHS